jgi:hypothetical protein
MHHLIIRGGFMKRTLEFLLCCMMTISLCACSASTVEIKLPQSLMQAGEEEDSAASETPQDYCTRMLKEDGIKGCTVEADGVKLTMTKAKHEELMSEMRKKMDEAVQSLTAEEAYSSIKSITHDDIISTFTITVDKAAFESSFAGMAVLALVVYGVMYNTLAGHPDQKITFQLKDQDTGEQFDQSVYPDDYQGLFGATASPAAN